MELKNIPVFYIDILKAWAEVQDASEVHDKIRIEDIILWNNKHITIDGKSIYWKDWHDAGIQKIKDLLDENNMFLTFNKFCSKTGFKVPFTKLYGLISANPCRWKCALRIVCNINTPDAKDKNFVQANKLTCKRARNIFIQRKFEEH